MATGGAGARTKGNEMIKPMRRKNLCRQHPDDVCKAYCEDCQALICQECILSEHRRHNFGPAADALEKLRSEIKASKPKLERRRDETKAAVDKANRDVAATEKRHRAELDELKKRQAAELKKVKGKKAEVEKEEGALGDLVIEVSNVTPDTDMAVLVELKPRVVEALQGETSETISDQQTKKLLPVVRKARGEATHGNVGDAALVSANLSALELYLTGKATSMPKDVFPSLGKAYNNDDGTVQCISGDTARALASQLGHKHPAAILSIAGPNNNFVLVTGDQPSHAYTSLYEQPEDTSTWYWLPTSLTVVDAILSATGKSPSRVTERYIDRDVPLHHTVQRWFDTAKGSSLSYWL